MKRNIKLLVILALILLAGFGIIVGISNSQKQSEKPTIVTTNFPAYDFTRAIAGDKVEIKMLLKPGTEMHDYEPSPSDIIDIQKSKLFVYNGGESDEWVEEILESLEPNKTLKMTDAVELVEEEVVEGMETQTDEEPEFDEHVWTSPKNAKKIVNHIKDALVEIFPEDRASFEQNAADYTVKLDELDNIFQRIVDNGKRKTIVFGDRFPLRYFADEYGLDYYAAFPGCSEQNEASSATVAFLVDKVKSEEIPVVFKIEMSSSKLAQTIANEAGAKVLTFHSAHNISVDDFNAGATYVDIMEQNLTVLEEALQ